MIFAVFGATFPVELLKAVVGFRWGMAGGTFFIGEVLGTEDVEDMLRFPAGVDVAGDSEGGEVESEYKEYIFNV